MKKLLSIIVVLAAIFSMLYIANDVSENALYTAIYNQWKEISENFNDVNLDNVEDTLNDILAQLGSKPAGGTTTTKPNKVDVPEIPEGSDFQVHYIDVGQADCMLIICDDEVMLIDGGNDGDGEDVVAYLQQQQIEEIDLLVATHCHEDHLGGLDYVLEAFTVEEVWYPEYRCGSVNETMFLERVASQGITPVQPDPGTTYLLGSSICQVVGPISLDHEDPNNMSIVIKVVYGETSFLFTGDAELDEETEILDAGYDISCTVLKVGHHGSSGSTKYRWLKSAAPTYAIIPVGAGNSYGHPTEALLSRLEDADAITYRTDLQGHIICISDGKSVSFVFEKGGDSA